MGGRGGFIFCLHFLPHIFMEFLPSAQSFRHILQISIHYLHFCKYVVCEQSNQSPTQLNSEQFSL